jgi:hypothetical protein
MSKICLFIKHKYVQYIFQNRAEQVLSPKFRKGPTIVVNDIYGGLKPLLICRYKQVRNWRDDLFE